MTALERFERNFPKGGPVDCWVWTGGVKPPRRKTGVGYGSMFYQGKYRGAHRISWLLYRGEIPAGLQVLHRCDNPLCVNPNHLFLGTHADNMADKRAKGRECHPPAGERHHKAKLAEFEVCSIRKSPFPKTYLAATYGVSICTINDIQKRRSWRHVE